MTAPLVCIGIAGLGRMGRRHAQNLAHRVHGAKLVAACSPVEDELAWARATLGVAGVYTEYAQMLAHPGLDAVFLVTPTTLHAGQIIEALAAGKHVFSEKPLALNLADCLRVEAEAARHPRLKVMIGYVRRFDASYRAAHDRIAAGAISRPFLVHSQTADRNDPGGFFVRFAPTSGGILLDMSVHDIDAARWLLGAAGATIEFEGGQIATLYASRTMAHGHETATEIIGTAGRLTIGRNPSLDRVETADAHGVRNECTPTFYERFAEAFLCEAQAFVDVVAEDRATPLTLHDATEATRIGIAVTESLRTKRTVELDRVA